MSHTPEHPSPTNGLAPIWIDRGLLAVILLACALCVSHHNADPDLWGHVRYGLDLMQHGLPAVNTFSYNAADHPWINHELVSELLMAGGLTWLGPSIMLLLKCGLGVAAFSLMWRQARRDGVSQFVVAAAVLLAATNLMHFWVMRPQLYSYFFFAILIALLSWTFEGWRNRNLLSVDERAELSRSWSSSRLNWLWAAPPLFAVWTNTHGGFAAGLCIFAAYLGLRIVEAFAIKREDRWRIAFTLASVGGASAAATMLNPYGWRLHAWMLHSLGQARPEITEWLPPEFNIVWAPFWVLTGVLAVAWCFGRKRDATHTIILALVLSQALEHRRHIAFLAILVGFWLAPVLGAAAKRIGVGVDLNTFGEGLAAPQRKRFGAALAFCAAMLGMNLFTQFGMITVKRDQYPVAAFEFMAEKEMKGKLVTRFMWAQYALYAFGSDSPETGIQIAFDGRFRTCYPQDIVDTYFDFAVGNDGLWPRNRSADSPPPESARILRLNSPDLVLLDRSQKHAVATMAKNSDGWTLLYQDRLAQLWGRSKIYADPTLSTYIAPEHRPVGDYRQEGIDAWPAAELAHSAWSAQSLEARRILRSKSEDANFWLSHSKPITNNRLNHADSANSP